MADGSVAGVVSLQGKVSAEEWQARVDLAALYRLVAMYGWDDLIYTHISARIPGPEHHFLINPYGMMFEEITASSLVKVDLEGRKAMDSPHEINPAGFVIHSAIHAARDDAACVLHLHTLDGVALSAQADGVLPVVLRHGTEFVQDPLLLRAPRAPIPAINRLHMLLFGLHTHEGSLHDRGE